MLSVGDDHEHDRMISQANRSMLDSAVLGAAPAGPHLRQDRLGGGEGAQALEAARLGKGITTGAGEPAVGEGSRASLLERDEEAAEPEFAAPAADDEAPSYGYRSAGCTSSRRGFLRPPLSVDTVARIFELSADGLSVKKIGKALGIAAWTVSRYVRSFEEGDR